MTTINTTVDTFRCLDVEETTDTITNIFGTDIDLTKTSYLFAPEVNWYTLIELTKHTPSIKLLTDPYLLHHENPQAVLDGMVQINNINGWVNNPTAEPGVMTLNNNMLYLRSYNNVEYFFKINTNSDGCLLVKYNRKSHSLRTDHISELARWAIQTE